MSLENFPSFLLNFSEGEVNGEKQNSYRFKSFRLNVEERQLLNNNEKVSLTPRAFDVLTVLVRRNGHLVEKNELLNEVWADSFVEEANIARIIHTLRKVLGEDENGGKYIETVAKKGYRFVAKVQTLNNHSVQPIAVEQKSKNNNDSAIANETQPFKIKETKLADKSENSIENHNSHRKIFIASFCAILLISLFTLGFYTFSKVENINHDFRQIKFNRLTNSGNIKLLTISPDGNFIAFVSDEKQGESLSVRQIEMSNSISLVPPKKGNFSFLTFSPDGKFIYYSFFSGDKSDAELYSVPTLGGISRKIPNTVAYWMSFAPNGKDFAHVVSNMAEGEKALMISSLESNENRILSRRKIPRSFNIKEQPCAWSPDGKTIAIISNEIDADKRFSLIVGVNASDGSEKPLSLKRWEYVHSIQWLKDGSGVIVIGHDKSQTRNQVWFVSAATGETKVLTNDLYNYSYVGAMAINQLVSVQETQTSSIWLGSSEQDSNDFKELISETGLLDTIVLTANNLIIFRSNADGRSNLWTMQTDGSGRKQLTVDAQVDERGLCATPDGKQVVFPSSKAGKVNLWSADVGGGEAKQLTNGDGEFYPICMPDNQSVIYQKGFGYGVKSTIWKIPMKGGTPIQLTNYFSMRPTLSPDGRRIAFFYQTNEKWRIGIVSSEGGTIEQSLDVPDGVHDRVARWSHNGKSVLYSSNSGEVGNIWLLPLNGEQPKQITNFEANRIEDFFLTKDGHRLITTRTNIINDVVSLTWEP